MTDFIAVVFIFIVGFIGCFVIFPFWLGSWNTDIKEKKEEIRELQDKALDKMEEYKCNIERLDYNIGRKVDRIQDLIEKMQVPLKEYIYENLTGSDLKNFIKYEMQEKFKGIERDLMYQLEKDMCEIKHKVEEVVTHFEKDDKQRLIEYVEKSFEKDGKQIILERLKNK